MQKARKNNIEIYAGCLYFNVGPKRRFLQTFLAPSSEMLDLFQSWHLQHLFWANLERKKNHMLQVLIKHKVNIAPFFTMTFA